MKLWLLCFVLIFAAAEGLQGFSGWPTLDLTSFWHPLTVLAGIGLAVLSNAAALGLGSNPSLPAPTQPPPDIPAAAPPRPPVSATVAPAHGTTPATASSKTKASKTKATKTKATPKIKATQAKANSISFEIRKPSQPESPQP